MFNSRKRRFGIESLEDRTMMAGDAFQFDADQHETNQSVDVTDIGFGFVESPDTTESFAAARATSESIHTGDGTENTLLLSENVDS